MQVILSIAVLVGVGAVVWRLFNAAFSAPGDFDSKSLTQTSAEKKAEEAQTEEAMAAEESEGGHQTQGVMPKQQPPAKDEEQE